MDPPWVASEDLVKIARGKFMEADGASKLPFGIKYLSIHCYISQLVLSSPSEAKKVPVLGFLQTANTKWNSLWERLLPDFAWRPVRGGLCCNEEFKKSWPRYSMTHIKMEPVLYGLKCSSKASLGAATRAAARPGCLLRQIFVVGVLSRAIKHILLPGQVRTRAALCKQA